MGVASHLGIDIREYDARIRTFIPHYEAMLDAGARVVPRGARTIVDLGTGTGALAARCLKRAGRARLVGIDADPAMLDVASRRLNGAAPRDQRAAFVTANFLRAPLPRCDAVVSSFALHHIRTRAAKGRLYARIRSALRPGGALISVDCQPSRDRAAARREFAAWRAHLARCYSPRHADAFLAAWAKEDVYVPLEAEMALLERAGFRVRVVWRRDAFAVLSASARR